MIALPWKMLCANFILPCGENHYGFFLRCPTSFYNRPFKKYVSLARKRHPNLFRAKSYSPHSMRHSTATHMLEAGVPLIVIKNFLGHSSLQTTQVYAAVSQCTLNKHIQDWNKKWFSDDGSLEHQLKAEIPSFLI